MGADLVRGAAFGAGDAAVAVPEGMRAAVFSKDVMLPIVDAGTTAGFFYYYVAGFSHKSSPHAKLYFKISIESIPILP